MSQSLVIKALSIYLSYTYECKIKLYLIPNTLLYFCVFAGEDATPDEIERFVIAAIIASYDLKISRCYS